MSTETPIIKSLAVVKSAGVWNDFRSPANGQFAQRTLIYGYNGTGKTTLTRIFSSIQGGIPDENLPKGASFHIDFSSGPCATTETSDHPQSNNILVFNSDFVLKNLSFDTSKTEGIAYISAEQIGDKAKLDSVSNAIENLNKEIDVLNQKIELKKKEEAKFLKDTATEYRGLREGTIYTQSYNATHVRKQYESNAFGEEQILTASDLGANVERLKESKPPNVINYQPSDAGSCLSWIEDVVKVRKLPLSALVTDRILSHPDATRWVQDGLKYHVENDLDKCLFCDNTIHNDRKEFLKSIFTLAWFDAIGKIDEAVSSGDSILSNLRDIYRESPNELDISTDLRQRYSAAKQGYLDAIGILGVFASEQLEQLKRVAKDPVESTNTDQHIQDFDLEHWRQKFESARADIQQVVGEHNDMVNRHKELQKNALEELEGHVLAKGQADWRKLDGEMRELNESLNVSMASKQEREQEKSALIDSMVDTAAAAQIMNRMIEKYLNHNEILLESEGSGFRIRRLGGEYATHLSEGEKTAIAFCYFLTKLNEIGRDIEKLILIIDDPVSSLDINARNTAFGLLKTMTDKCALVIILTHNSSFMQMVKRDFGQRKGSSSAFLFLDCRINAEEKHRSTRLVEMPSLLMNYETEYYYLFQVVHAAATKGESTYLYFLPNAIRKLLEIFLGFYLPKKSGLREKLDKYRCMVEREFEIDALERLVQVESHGEVHGVSEPPDFSLEMASKVAKQAMIFVEQVSEAHYKGMMELLEDAN